MKKQSKHTLVGNIAIFQNSFQVGWRRNNGGYLNKKLNEDQNANINNYYSPTLNSRVRFNKEVEETTYGQWYRKQCLVLEVIKYQKNAGHKVPVADYYFINVDKSSSIGTAA